MISEDADDDYDRDGMEKFTGEPASLMGTQESRVGTEASKCLGKPAALMGTQGNRESTENHAVLTHRSIGMLMTITPEVISSVQEDGWEEVDLVVDSGASEIVIGPDMVQSVEVTEGPAYRQGV